MGKEVLIELNDRQHEAVECTEGYLRVIAGAGSGKTKLLVSRYAYLVKEVGIDSANILCVTFTNKAASEMKRRIRTIIGDTYDTTLICTYHGFCVRVLREDIEKIFYPKGFQILDESMQKSILKEIYQNYELKLDYASFEKVLADINKFKTERTYVESMCKRGNVQILPEINTIQDHIIEDYLQKQKSIYGMDFNDLMYFTLYMFNKCPDVLEKWQERLNYIQVDEFQDSSSTEMELIDKLSAIHKNLMIVGDPDQNIYEWRGSDVKLLVDFDETHVPTKTILLNENYRSTPAILKVANEVIDHNKMRIKKELFTRNNNADKVIHFHTKNEFDEAKQIVDKINELHKVSGVKFNEFTVLYRSSYLSRIIEKKFTEDGIPYEIYGGVKFYQRMEIQDILAYLKLIAFDDDMSFKRIINTPKRQFGRVKLRKLVELQENNESLFETLKKQKDNICANNPLIDSFVSMIENFRKQKLSEKISSIVEKVCNESNYEKYIRELGDMERFENLSEFKRISNEFENNYGESITLEEFINQISLQSNENEENEDDQVKLMTIHAAKGLEFNNVFIVGFSEGIFPSPKTIEERKEEGLEEERRLCYVALTRAKERLYVLDSEGFTQNGKQKLPSRFLREMGEENYIRIGNISRELMDASERYVNVEKFVPQKTNDYNIGDRVKHKIYGEGTVVNEKKKRNTYEIQFDNLKTVRDISKNYFTQNNNDIKFKVQEKPINSNVYNNIQKNNIIDDFIKQTKFENNEDNSKIIKDNASSDVQDISVNRTSFQNKVENKIPKKIVIDWDDPDDFNHKKIDLKKENVKKEKPDLSKYTDLWKDDRVPKSGWTCVGITDLGGPYGVCEMCGKQIIRYVHHMQHPNYKSLGVGCVCAGKMEGSLEKAKLMEEKYKGDVSRLNTFLKKKWKITSNGNRCVTMGGHFIVLFYDYIKDEFSYTVDSEFSNEYYETAREAKIAIFERLK